jgi:hypothetical protein
MNSIVQLYHAYLERFAIINSSDNLSKYRDKESHYFKSIKKYKVFKKSNSSVNTYYWIVNNDCSCYYTTTDDDVETLQHILRVTKISELRTNYVNYYFEFILFSYIMGENITLLNELKEKHTVTLSNGVKISTQEYSRAQEYSKTPVLMIEYEGQLCIIDDYNGSSEKEIRSKINVYSQHFPGACVYVFSSGVSRLEQLSTKTRPTFSFHCITDGNLTEVPEISRGPLVLKISDLSNNYFSEYSIFKSEIFYWMSCEQQGCILRTHESEF